MNLKTLCTPAKIYFAITVLSAIWMLVNNVNAMAVIIKLVFAFLWTLVLGWLCKKGYEVVSWILVLMPFVLMFAASKNRYTSELLETYIVMAGSDGDPEDD